MIDLVTDQPVAGAPEFRVVAGGAFAPDALVECYRVAAPDQRVAYQAQFVATGEAA